MNKIFVAAKQRNYTIYIESGYSTLIEKLLPLFTAKRHIFVITDENVKALYGDELLGLLNHVYETVDMLAVPPGEESKNLRVTSEIYEYLLEKNADRSSVLIALGGGVIGDLTGFVASTYMRGISFVQIPTTLLSQVDSSVGGKTGVDFRGSKNIVGTFYQPSLVYINTNTLKTLPKREFSSGLAEVIKYGIIMDSSFFNYLVENVQNIKAPEILEVIISKSISFKAEIVEKDENDLGIREILNFGHTIGHAIEKLSGFGLLHGEAVALGMISALHISAKRNKIEPDGIESVKRFLRMAGLPQSVHLDKELILNEMSRDKKKSAGKLTFILIKRIGSAYGANDLTASEILDGIGQITERE